MESITKIIADFEKKINDLQRDNEGLIQTLNCVSASVETLDKKVDTLEKGLATKADITHVQLINKKSEIIKKINDSKPVEVDCKVGISLDGKVSLESIVEHTTDSIKCGVIKGSEINETR
ncbi:hypothetical protein P9Z94_29505 [Bacillus thuringiensis]|uniref:hypothetical protein n=1 Tax=Bacillus thuringiensis TaxID=1428 RepID=UPI002DBBF936|nr:hypothetical protein [Bacillus thuringiensis]MEC3160139.1 hypothetical protein [Bacillus thuringiensis]